MIPTPVPGADLATSDEVRTAFETEARKRGYTKFDRVPTSGCYREDDLQDSWRLAIAAVRAYIAAVPASEPPQQYPIGTKSNGGVTFSPSVMQLPDGTNLYAGAAPAPGSVSEHDEPTHPNHPGHHDGHTCEAMGKFLGDLGSQRASVREAATATMLDAAPVSGVPDLAEIGCYCGGFDDVHQDGCPEIAAPLPAAPAPTADDPVGDFQAEARQAKFNEMAREWTEAAPAPTHDLTFGLDDKGKQVLNNVAVPGEGDKFRAHLQWASDEVATWPAWKQRVAAPAPTDADPVLNRMHACAAEIRALKTPAPTEQAGELPPYVYARECGPNEKVWTEDAVRKLMAARQAPTEQPKGLPTLRVPITDDEMAALRRFDECARDGAGYDVGTDMMKALASIGLVRHLSAGRYEHTSFGLAVLSGDVAGQSPDSRDAALTEAQIRTIKFAADALEGLDYEDTAGDLRAIAQEKAQ